MQVFFANFRRCGLFFPEISANKPKLNSVLAYG